MISAKNLSINPCLRFSSNSIRIGANTKFIHNNNDSRDNLASSLFLALKRKNQLMANLIIKKTNSIEIEDEFGNTPLHIAALHGLSLNVASLIKSGANLNASNIDGSTPLMYASQNGHEYIVRLLTSAGAEVDKVDKSGFTAFHLAVLSHQCWVMDYLLNDAGANIDKCVTSTPLMEVSRVGIGYTAGLLLYKGANPDIVNEDGDTALHIAARNGSWLVAEYLVKNRANLNITNNKGMTPLMVAIENKNEFISDLLIQSGARIDTLNKRGQSALHLAAIGGLTDTVKALINLKANIDGGNGCSSPLIEATKLLHKEIIYLLLSSGASVHRVDKNGNTALHFATKQGCIDLVKTLVCAGADPNAPNYRGVKPENLLESKYFEILHAKKQSIIEILKSADKLLVNKEHNKALHTATSSGCIKTVIHLLANHYDINTLNEVGSTPLMEAIRNGHDAVASLLISKGADLNVTNHNGETALNLAVIYQKYNIVQLIMDSAPNNNFTNKHKNR